MAKLKRSIFERERIVKPSQLKQVASRRYDDARFLVEKGGAPRANAAMYLGGFAIECLLKAKLLCKYEWISRQGATETQSSRIVSLFYRSHDLSEMLVELPEVEQQLRKVDEERGTDSLRKLKKICGEWTIHARYSTRSADADEASRFLNDIREVKRWLE